MNDDSILDTISALVEQERQLRGRQAEGTPDARKARGTLRDIEVELDQCWDLLRQRHAKQEFGANPDAATPRPASVVENYWQ